MRAFATNYWGGEGTLVECVMELGAYPERDVNYAETKI
jgi:hypothetical protein